MTKNKFFLQDFFKNHYSGRSLDIPWNNTAKDIKRHEKEIAENIRKMGDFSSKDFNPKSLKIIYSECQIYWKKHNTFKELPSKELKNLRKILFSNPYEGVKKGLYDNHDQFEDFLSALIQKTSQRDLKGLISDLLYHYPEDKNTLFKRLNKIYNSLDKNKNSNKSLFEANSRFQLIEELGPYIIAENILSIKKNLDALLPEFWIKEKHLSNGIGENIVKELCKLVQQPFQRLSKQPAQEKDDLVLRRFLEYLSGGKKPVSETVMPSQSSVILGRYRDIQPVVKALLNPFEYKAPKKNIKIKITQFLDQHIGDPRFFSEKWISMPNEKGIFLRWKIGETIKDFLELLSYTAKKDPSADRMWPYRKEFIESYWSAGHTTAAWIILGREAYKDRSKFLKENFNDYGRITKGATSLHSCLLYQIGNLVVSEWSHNAKVSIWNEGNRSVPVFYEKEYSKGDLVKNPDIEIIHSSAERYYWQKKLSDDIDEYTGISCPEGLRRKIDQFQ